MTWCLTWWPAPSMQSWWPAWRVTDDVPGFPRFFHAYCGRLQLTVRLR